MFRQRRRLDRPVEGCRLHKVRPARRGRAGDTGAERHRTEGLVRGDHRQIRQQSQQQQQGDTAIGRLSRTTGDSSLRRADPPPDRPLQVHSTVATIQVPTRLYSLYPRILSLTFLSFYFLTFLSLCPGPFSLPFFLCVSFLLFLFPFFYSSFPFLSSAFLDFVSAYVTFCLFFFSKNGNMKNFVWTRRL